MQSEKPNKVNGEGAAHHSLRVAVALALRSMLADIRGIAEQQLELLALEARKTIRDLYAMAALAVVSASLLAAAWIGTTAACAVWLLEMGVRTSLAVLLASCLNLLVASAALLALRRLWRAPRFPATRKSLGLSLRQGSDTLT